MALAVISFGPKLGLLNNAGIGEVYYDEFRPFLRGMDALVQASVLGRQNTPPTSPNDGDAYIVLTGATGAWAGNTNNIAVYSTQITALDSNNLTPGWDFYTPNPGWGVYSIADELFYYVDSSGNWKSALATETVAGSVKPDGTTITISSGVISASIIPIGVVLVTYSSTPTFDASLGLEFKITLTGNVTSSLFINGTAGPSIIVFRIVQDGAGGRTFVWPSNVRNGGTINSDANGRSMQAFAVDTDGSLDAIGPMMYS